MSPTICLNCQRRMQLLRKMRVMATQQLIPQVHSSGWPTSGSPLHVQLYDRSWCFNMESGIWSAISWKSLACVILDSKHLCALPLLFVAYYWGPLLEAQLLHCYVVMHPVKLLARFVGRWYFFVKASFSAVQDTEYTNQTSLLQDLFCNEQYLWSLTRSATTLNDENHI